MAEENTVLAATPAAVVAEVAKPVGETVQPVVADPAKQAETLFGKEGAKPAVAEPGKEGTTETKAKDGEADKAKSEGAPETYTDFVVPEGMTLDKAVIEQFLPIAKELNLSQEQAQKLVDLDSKRETARAEASTAAWNKITTDWVDTAKADKEIGGVGFNQNLADAQKTIKAFGTPELQAALNITGAGNHPEFIRIFARIGKALNEDSFKTGGTPSNAPKSAAETLYPKQGK